MTVAGGDNLELSIRVWTCGGTLEIHPCSHIGHVRTLPVPEDADALNRNLKRLAEVWLDDYKTIFYNIVPAAHTAAEGEDLAQRHDLRKQLACKPFSWFLSAVCPDVFVPLATNAQHRGLLTVQGTNRCLDVPESMRPESHACDNMGGDQDWYLTASNQVIHLTPNGDKCLAAVTARLVSLETCDSSLPRQEWELNETGLLRSKDTGACLSYNTGRVELAPCEKAAKWEFKKSS